MADMKVVSSVRSVELLRAASRAVKALELKGWMKSETWANTFGR
jgi:hypothetical protein